MKRNDPIALRLYRHALALLPRDFRRTHGRGMEAMVRDEWAARRGLGRGALLVRAGVDLVWTAMAVRGEAAGSRDEGRMTMRWTEIGSDVRVSLRSLARSPLFTTAAVVSLALGVGGVATVYAVADRLLLRPLGGVSDPERLIEIVPDGISYPAYQDLAENLGSLEGLAAHRMRGVALDPGGGADPRPVQAGLVSGSYFDVVGVSAARGRVLGPADDRPGAPPVAVLSHALWTEMGSPADVLGSELRANGAALRVVGVAPEDFEGTRLWVRPAFWMTIGSWPAASLGRTPDVHSRGWGWLSTVGRIRAGTDLAAVTAEVRAVSDRIAASDDAYERFRGDAEVTVVTARVRAADVVGDVLGQLLLTLAGVVALTLFAAAMNVANLLLARASRRTRELGIRAALGADRMRLGRLLAVESTVLTVVGLTAGFALAALALRGLAGVRLPYGMGVEAAALRLDGRMMLLAGGTLVLVTLLAGMAPVLSAARTRPEGLTAGRGTTASGRSLRLRSVFAALQIAVGVVLLAGTALFGRSFLEALRVDLGFDPDGLGVVRLDTSLFHDDRPAGARAVERFVERMSTQPGVAAASWSRLAPLTEDEEQETFQIVGRTFPGGNPSVEVNAVGADFFRAVGIPLVGGAADPPAGTDAPPVAVINEAMAERHWPGEDPLGARIVVMGEEMTVAGVAADTRFHGFASAPGPYVFAVMAAPSSSSASVVLRGTDVAAALRSARELARTVDPRLVVAEVGTGPGLVDFLLAPQRLGGLVFLLFATLALGLALTGIWGIVAYGVGTRLGEFGVRLSLGARPAQVTAAVLRRNLAPLVAGALLGLAASVALTRVVAAFLYGVQPDQLQSPILAAVLVLGMGLLFTWLPARRAGRVDPASALASE